MSPTPAELAAFAVLRERHLDAVRRSCPAEDLVTAVFREAWRHRRAMVLLDGTALPWLLDLADDVVRTDRRRTRHRRLVAAAALVVCAATGALAAGGLAVGA